MKHQLTLSEYRTWEQTICKLIHDLEKHKLSGPTLKAELINLHYNIISKREDLEEKLSVLT